METSWQLILVLSIRMMLSIDSNCNNGTCTPFSIEEKQAILDLHNELRDRVAGGGLYDEGHPMATDMNYLIWDDGLQSVAQAHAESCSGLTHNSNRNFQIKYERDATPQNTKWGIKDGKTLDTSWCGAESCIFIGENLMTNFATTYDLDGILSQIESEWWDQYKDWTYGAASSGCASICGHYTQMTWANTRYIGCGYANGCSTGGWNAIFICNYFPIGNFNPGSTPPYTSGGNISNCNECMSDRTECKSMYVSQSINAASYPDQPYNALCDGGACATMCDGDSYSIDTCDECTPTPLNIDCNDGTIALNDGRYICSSTPFSTTTTNNPSSTPTKFPTSHPPTSDPTLSPSFNPTSDPNPNPVASDPPTSIPTKYPNTPMPTTDPTTQSPTTEFPTYTTYPPTTTETPTTEPTDNPTSDPTLYPSFNPSITPTLSPTITDPTAHATCSIDMSLFDGFVDGYNGEWLEQGTFFGRTYYARNAYYLYWTSSSLWCISTELGSSTINAYCEEWDLLSCTEGSWRYWYTPLSVYLVDADATIINIACYPTTEAPTVLSTSAPTGPTQSPTTEMPTIPPTTTMPTDDPTTEFPTYTTYTPTTTEQTDAQTDDPAAEPTMPPTSYPMEPTEVPTQQPTYTECDNDEDCEAGESCKYESLLCLLNGSDDNGEECKGICVDDDNFCEEADVGGFGSWHQLLNSPELCDFCYCKDKGAQHCVNTIELAAYKEQWQDRLDELCPYTQYPQLEDNGDQCAFKDLVIEEPPSQCSCDILQCAPNVTSDGNNKVFEIAAVLVVSVFVFFM